MGLNSDVHDFFYGKRRKPPPTPISIPNFSYPKYIYDYLMSQSKGYKITFTRPNDTKVEYKYDPNEPPATTKPTTKPAATTTPIPFEKYPAYYTATTTPAPKNTTAPKRTLPPIPFPTPTLSPNIPPFWLAAINGMIFLNDLGVITTKSKLTRLYDKLKSELPKIMGGKTDPKKNLGALVFFNTVIVQAFIPFNESFTYNYLNGKYPEIFPDGKSYRNICMLNFYAIHSSTIFNKFSSGGYVASDDKVMKYMVPQFLSEVLELLKF
jgi:hypothetical protein